MRLWFNIHSVAKICKKLKGDPLETLKKFPRVSQSRKGGSLVVPKQAGNGPSRRHIQGSKIAKGLQSAKVFIGELGTLMIF